MARLSEPRRQRYLNALLRGRTRPKGGQRGFLACGVCQPGCAGSVACNWDEALKKQCNVPKAVEHTVLQRYLSPEKRGTSLP